jgi:hypothetical protein
MDNMTADQFLHNQVITGAKLNVSDFDTNLKTVITDFNKRLNAFNMKPTDAGLLSLQAQSRLIAQHIYDYYVDKDDQTADFMNTATTKVEIKEAIKEIKEESKDPKPEPKPTDPNPAPIEPPAPPAPPAEEEPKNKNEKALHSLFSKGVKEGITKAMLKAEGFDTELASIRGCRVGKYNLHKSFSDTTYRLERI